MFKHIRTSLMYIYKYAPCPCTLSMYRVQCTPTGDHPSTLINPATLHIYFTYPVPPTYPLILYNLVYISVNTL